MRFEKWQALGNDYVIVEAEELPFALTPARIRRLCEPHVGVFADGVLVLSRPANAEHVADLRIFNPDGSEAELSGNGAREAILYARRHGWTEADEFAIHTPAGDVRPRITGPDTCTVDMGAASTTSKDFPDGPPDGRGTVSSDGREWDFRHVSIGNPQCAIGVGSPAELEALDLDEVGPSIERDAQFPNRTNVSWYAELERPLDGADGPRARIRARIFERGVGETLSSGTGASGAAVAYALELRERAARGGEGAADAQDGAPALVTVALDGGELDVQVAGDLRVNLTGWARPVFAGGLSEDFVTELKELHETE